MHCCPTCQAPVQTQAAPNGSMTRLNCFVCQAMWSLRSADLDCSPEHQVGLVGICISPLQLDDTLGWQDFLESPPLPGSAPPIIKAAQHGSSVADAGTAN